MKTRAQTPEKFLAAVRKQLPDITDERDAEVMDLNILQLQEEGWTVDEAVSYSKCFEEVNPQLEERAALQSMRTIREAVQIRLGKG